jgi:hypothetical protein
MTEEELEALAEGAEALKAELAALDTLANRFSSRLATGLSDILVKGRDVEDVFRSLALSLSQTALREALKPVTGLVTNGIGSLASGLTGALTGAITGGASGAASQSGSTVNVAINTPDIQSFQRAQSQVAASLALAVQRGQRGL